MFSGGPYFQSEYARMRHQELIQVAEQYRLLSQAAHNQENVCIQQYRLYQKALLKLGAQLVIWGTSLQRRYIRENDIPTLAAYQQRKVFGK
jgi:hypothetical protein